MQGFLVGMLGGRLRTILMVAFSLIAAITIAVGAVATSRTITDYLAQAADERVARDMDLARAFYQTRLERVARVSQRLALSPTLSEMLSRLAEGDVRSLLAIQAVQRIQKVLQTPLALKDLFEAPTVASLAERIRTSLRKKISAQLEDIVAVDRDALHPLSFSQQRIRDAGGQRCSHSRMLGQHMIELER